MINYVDNTETCGKVLDCRLLLAVGGRLTFFVWDCPRRKLQGGCPFLGFGFVRLNGRRSVAPSCSPALSIRRTQITLRDSSLVFFRRSHFDISTPSPGELWTKGWKSMRQRTADPNLRYPWQEAVLEALIEYPPVRDKIHAAEGAISARLCQKTSDAEETVALHDALVALQIVFPEIKPGSERSEQSEISF